MNQQRGYINIDLAAVATCLIAVGVACGIAIAWLAPIIWRLVKPWIHAITS